MGRLALWAIAALMALAFKSSREGWDDRPADPDKP